MNNEYWFTKYHFNSFLNVGSMLYNKRYIIVSLTALMLLDIASAQSIKKQNDTESSSKQRVKDDYNLLNTLKNKGVTFGLAESLEG